jgi:hypothetical protein
MDNLNKLNNDYSNDTIVEFYISLFFLCFLLFILFGEAGYANEVMNEVYTYNNKDEIQKDD